MIYTLRAWYILIAILALALLILPLSLSLSPFPRSLADDAAIEATGAAFQGEELFLPLGSLRILSANRFPSRYYIRFRDESDGRDLHESEKTFVRVYGKCKVPLALNSDEITRECNIWHPWLIRLTRECG